MVQQVCRLCFKEDSQPIGIFSAEGIELKMAEVLRLHFPDEVDENDLLPRFVCLDCWIKLDYFDEFYNAVAEAKSMYLGNAVKCEEPKFVEANCNAVGFDMDMLSPKTEPIIEIGTFEPLSHLPRYQESEIELCDGERRGYSRKATQASNDRRDSRKNGKATRNIIKCESFAEETLDSDAMAELARTVFGMNKSTISAAEKKIAHKRFRQMIPNYIDMNCEFCKYKFTSLNEAFQHYRRNHKLYKLKVKCCPQRIYGLDIRDHILVHLHPDLLKCNECGKKFVAGRLYRLHMHLHKTTVPFECDICKKKFKGLENVRNHILRRHGSNKNRFECEICKKRFSAKGTMRVHIKIVHQNFRHICHVCAKEFRTLGGLEEHLLTHEDVPRPRVKCELCPSTFKNSLGLYKHVVALHADDPSKTFQCPHCPAVKKSARNLSNHIYTMHTLKLMKCQLCEREFRDTKSYRGHMEMHASVDLLKCDYCPKQYPTKRSLTSHMKNMHKAEWTADTKRDSGIPENEY